ncbi:hypothetical protein M9Y10_026617 [Tritrichomonas musculus]|uniref:Ankyrin n=1 Tax=Tritrichomonas musculus TaxID=1915356 RepID=A0ABR2H7G6_9EUKA
MNISQYLDNKRNLQEQILNVLTSDPEKNKENFNHLLKTLEEQQIQNDVNELRSFLHLISNIEYNHHRCQDFYETIGKILLIYKDEIAKQLSNHDIFDIFQKNKRTLLFLMENDILKIDQHIANLIKNYHKEFKYPNYFINEIKCFFSPEFEKQINEENKEKDKESFLRKRRTGENDNDLCYIIRNDLIDEFVQYVSKTNIKISETIIQPSIYETNVYLMDRNPTLMEYAAFFGSLQIIQYLRLNNVSLKSSLWNYSIHSDNADLIHFLEEYRVKPENNSYFICYCEAIRCHHNEIALYIKENYLKADNIQDNYLISTIIRYYNYILFPNMLYGKIMFYEFCSYDYYFIVKNHFLKNPKFNVEYKIKPILMQNDIYLHSPLAIAVKKNNTDIVSLLLERPEVDVNFQTQKYNSAKCDENVSLLHIAVTNNNKEIIQMLLNRKEIDVNMYSSITSITQSTVEERKESPLLKAIYNKNIDIIKLLMSHDDIDPNQKGVITSYNKDYCGKLTLKEVKETFPLHESINLGNQEIINLLLSNQKIDVNICSLLKNNDIEKGETPLYLAIQKSQKETIELLLDNPRIDVNIDSFNKTKNKESKEPSLILAIRNKKASIIKLLLAHKNINVNVQWKLVDKSRDLEEKNIPALYYAVELQCKDIVQSLLSNPNINVNAKYTYQVNICMKKEEATPFHSAIKNKNENILKMLLKKPNIDVNIKLYEKDCTYSYNENQITTMDLAISTNNKNIIHLLLESNKIDYNLKTTKYSSSGSSTMFADENSFWKTAIKNSNFEIFKELVEYFYMNHELSDVNWDELYNMASNSQMKAFIYNIKTNQ